MANKDNLIDMSQRSEEERRRLGSKGGKKSGATKRKKKAMREQAELLLSLPLHDDEVKDLLKSMGIDDKNLDNQMVMIVSMWQKAKAGDVQAATWLRDLCGEKPIEEIKVNANVDSTINDIERYVEHKNE